MPTEGPEVRRNAGSGAGINIVLPRIAGADENILLALVVGIVDALYRHPSTREALLRCGMPRREQPFVRLSQVTGGAPPAEIPLFNEQLAVLTVPCGELTVEDVREALAGSVPEGTVVELTTRARVSLSEAGGDEQREQARVDRADPSQEDNGPSVSGSEGS